MLPFRKASLYDDGPEEHQALFYDEDIQLRGSDNPLWHDDWVHYDEDLLLQWEMQPNLQDYTYEPILERQKAQGICSGFMYANIFFATFVIAGWMICHPNTAASSPVDRMCQASYNQTFPELLETVSTKLSFCDEEFSESCGCQSTIHSTDPMYSDRTTAWMEKFERNQESNITRQLDVVILGDDSILMEDRSVNEQSEWAGLPDLYPDLFTTGGGGQIDGLSLESGGERCGNLLYRLRNGELPDDLDPKVWWIMIGSNDLGVDHCSRESTVAGNIHIVEEIKRRHPKAKIVMNSILPSADEDGNLDTNWQRITSVNHQLECYSHVTEGVDFFDATSIFLNKDEEETVQNSRLRRGTIDSSASSARLLGEAILKKVLEMVDD